LSRSPGANRGGAQSDLTDKRFTGQYHESSLAGAEGLYYYNARWYDPALARFAQADTLVPDPGNPQALNRYAYVYNNPARYTDPSGHDVGIDPIKYPQSKANRSSYPSDPLTTRQRASASRAAAYFRLPFELVAGTVAMEIMDDTDWYDAWLDTLFQEIPLSIHYGTSDPSLRATVDLFLTGYDIYFGRFGRRGPGNGVANVHMGTIREIEAYYAANYPEEQLLMPLDLYTRIGVSLTDEGNIFYAAAVLRRNADYRTGSLQSHLDDLSVTDMQMIYGRYRCDCWRDWEAYKTATGVPVDSRGIEFLPYLQLYAGN